MGEGCWEGEGREEGGGWRERERERERERLLKCSLSDFRITGDFSWSVRSIWRLIDKSVTS